jgi:hypothetical protein
LHYEVDKTLCQVHSIVVWILKCSLKGHVLKAWFLTNDIIERCWLDQEGTILINGSIDEFSTEWAMWWQLVRGSRLLGAWLWRAHLDTLALPLVLCFFFLAIMRWAALCYGVLPYHKPTVMSARKDGLKPWAKISLSPFYVGYVRYFVTKMKNG